MCSNVYPCVLAWLHIYSILLFYVPTTSVTLYIEIEINFLKEDRCLCITHILIEVLRFLSKSVTVLENVQMKVNVITKIIILKILTWMTGNTNMFLYRKLPLLVNCSLILIVLWSFERNWNYFKEDKNTFSRETNISDYSSNVSSNNQKQKHAKKKVKLPIDIFVETTSYPR